MWGQGSVQGCRWRLERDDGVTITVDFEADPIRLPLDDVPAAHTRDETAYQWAARQATLDDERPFFGVSDRCSPDYIIRIRHGESRHLLIGDACLADPKYHQGKKLDTVSHYVKTVAWKTSDGEVVWCHPMGGFALLTPPLTSWKDTELLKSETDVTVLAPSILNADGGESASRLRSMVARVVPHLQTAAEKEAS